MPDIIPRRQSRSSEVSNALLAQRLGNVIVGPTVVRLSRPAGDQHFRRAGFRGIGVEALALLVTFGLAELVGTQLAVGRTVGRNRTDRAPGYHGGRFCQTRQAVGGVPRRPLGARVQILDSLLR